MRKEPHPAVIITLQRTGGSFLAFCLSSHPEIFCTRGEPIAERGAWATACPDRVSRLVLVLHQQYYAVSMCKLIDSHAFKDDIWQYLTTQTPPIKVLWLVRENVLEQAVSHEINAGRREGRIHGHPTHVFQEMNLPPVYLEPAGVLKRCRNETERYSQLRKKLKGSGLPMMKLTYWDITGGENATEIPHKTAKAICRFLGVPNAPLYASMRKVHRCPLAETVTNWQEVEQALRGTEFERYLDEKWKGR